MTLCMKFSSIKLESQGENAELPSLYSFITSCFSPLWLNSFIVINEIWKRCTLMHFRFLKKEKETEASANTEMCISVGMLPSSCKHFSPIYFLPTALTFLDPCYFHVVSLDFRIPSKFSCDLVDWLIKMNFLHILKCKLHYYLSNKIAHVLINSIGHIRIFF